jgi:hypothetical protein
MKDKKTRYKIIFASLKSLLQRYFSYRFLFIIDIPIYPNGENKKIKSKTTKKTQERKEKTKKKIKKIIFLSYNLYGCRGTAWDFLTDNGRIERPKNVGQIMCVVRTVKCEVTITKISYK